MSWLDDRNATGWLDAPLALARGIDAASARSASRVSDNPFARASLRSWATMKVDAGPYYWVQELSTQVLSVGPGRTTNFELESNNEILFRVVSLFGSNRRAALELGARLLQVATQHVGIAFIVQDTGGMSSQAHRGRIGSVR